MKTADYWIKKLKLIPHPEGGYFTETYRSEETIKPAGLPKRYSGPRSFSTTIFFLLKGNDVSRLHRLKSDEMWHFYTGSCLTIHVISVDRRYSTIRLGANPERGEHFHALMRAGNWFGATVNNNRSYSLVGCAVAPGFDFADFEIGERRRLITL